MHVFVHVLHHHHLLIDEALDVEAAGRGLIELHPWAILRWLRIHLLSEIRHELSGWQTLNVFQAIENITEDLFVGLILGILVLQILVRAAGCNSVGQGPGGQAEVEMQAGHDGYATQNSKNWSLHWHTSTIGFIELIIKMIMVLMVSVVTINRIKALTRGKITIKSFGPLTTLLQALDAWVYT